MLTTINKTCSFNRCFKIFYHALRVIPGEKSFGESGSHDAAVKIPFNAPFD